MHPIDDSATFLAASKAAEAASNATVVINVSEMSQVGEARRAAVALAAQVRLNEVRTGELAIIVTELASNLARHASGGAGKIILRPVAPHGGSGGGLGEPPITGSGVELLAIDVGSGIANVNAALRDGYTTGRTPGTGLGAVRRLSGTFDLFSLEGRGVALVSRVWPGDPPSDSGFESGAVCVPVKGEAVCGDAWCVEERRGNLIALLADGLGHGPLAAEASQRAVGLFREHSARTPQQIVELLHIGLRPTRGAAIAIAEIDPKRGMISFCGVGNIAAIAIGRDGKARSLISHNGTLGAEARRISQVDQAWPAGGLLILSSDGVTSRWQVGEYPGLLNRHPAVVAGVVFRDHLRGRDDATVLAIRGPAAARGEP